MSTDEQIADKIAAYVASDQWKWLDEYACCKAWITNGPIILKAIKNIGPSDPWNYLSVYIGGKRWEIPFDLRKPLWEKCWPVFEKAEEDYKSRTKVAMLDQL